MMTTSGLILEGLRLMALGQSKTAHVMVPKAPMKLEPKRVTELETEPIPSSVSFLFVGARRFPD